MLAVDRAGARDTPSGDEAVLDLGLSGERVSCARSRRGGAGPAGQATPPAPCPVIRAASVSSTAGQPRKGACRRRGEENRTSLTATPRSRYAHIISQPDPRFRTDRPPLPSRTAQGDVCLSTSPGPTAPPQRPPQPHASWSTTIRPGLRPARWMNSGGPTRPQRTAGCANSSSCTIRRWSSTSRAGSASACRPMSSRPTSSPPGSSDSSMPSRSSTPPAPSSSRPTPSPASGAR